MTIGNQLINNFPNSIKKDGPVFSSMVANLNKNGVFETVLNNANDYAVEYRNCCDIYEQTGNLLDKTATFFTYLKRNTDESDVYFKRRLKSLFYRNGDAVWGTTNNIQNVFKSFFNNANIYLTENCYCVDDTDTPNLINNFDFEYGEQYWSINGNVNIDKAARFSQEYGADITNGGELYQKVNLVSSKDYYLHFFAKGNGKCIISKSVDGVTYYWNPATDFDLKTGDWTNGLWTSDLYSIEVNNIDWDDISIRISIDSDTEVQITFSSETTFYVDYIRLFEYLYPSFVLILHYENNVTLKSAFMAIDGEDSLDSPVDLYSYQSDENVNHNESFFTGNQNSGNTMALYNEMLDFYIKSLGVKGYFEIVNRNEEA